VYVKFSVLAFLKSIMLSLQISLKIELKNSLERPPRSWETSYSNLMFKTCFRSLNYLNCCIESYKMESLLTTSKLTPDDTGGVCLSIIALKYTTFS